MGNGPASVETLHPVGSVPNSPAAIGGRIPLGQVTWPATLAVLVGRSVFILAAQGVVAAVFALRGHPTPWNAAAPWWTVYANLVDIGCLVLLVMYTRREGIRLRDLVGRLRLRWGRDLFLGLACFACGIAFFGWGGAQATRLVLGTTNPDVYPGLLMARVLPGWAIVYSLFFWVVWSPTEEMTYQGFALPRLEALCGRTWLAVSIVAFWWALQHSFIPFIVDWQYVIWRFCFFLPGVLAFLLLYVRLRRLPPLILAHWGMDIIGAVLTLKFPSQ